MDTLDPVTPDGLSVEEPTALVPVMESSETDNILETIATTEPSTRVEVEEVEEVVIAAGTGTDMPSVTNTTAVMQSIIEALTNAASETAALTTGEEVEEEVEGEMLMEDPLEDHDTSTEGSQDDPSSSIAAAAAALQALANKASTLSPHETISQLQQALQQSIKELPGAVASLVNEVASEVVVMAKAAQHAAIAAEALIDSQPEAIKRTKRGKLKLHKCSECGKGFTLKVTLMRHLDLHTKEIRCQHCNKVFFSTVKRSAHIHHHHTPWSQKEKGAVCQVCNKAFYNNSKLKVHMRMHSGERPYACSFCEKTFQCSSHCKRHERLHTGEHPYVCETCGKGFGSPSNLKDHVYTHTKETPYKCDKCGRGFTQWGALQRHVAAIHDKKKDCKCDECGKSFARKDYLRFHVQKCHWHKCSLCKSSFEDEITFQHHVKNCNVIPMKTPSPRHRHGTLTSPQRRSMSARRSETATTRSPKKRPASEPRPSRKRPLPAESPSTRVTRKKKRHTMTPANTNSTELLSVYDQFDDDPLADPEYDTFEDQDELEGEETIEEDVQIDTEEVLEQEEISQLEDMTAENIVVLNKTDNTLDTSEVVNAENEKKGNLESESSPSAVDLVQIIAIPGEGGKLESKAPASPVKEGNPDSTVGETTNGQSENSKVSDEPLIQPEETSVYQAPSVSGETTLDSLVNALVSAAELQGAVLPDKEE